jgi:hypothetical protein
VIFFQCLGCKEVVISQIYQIIFRKTRRLQTSEERKSSS